MNRLPIEILEMIFCQLPAGTDFEKCVNTCTKWRKIIPDIYPNFDKTKVLVVRTFRETRPHLEIVDLIDPTLENVVLFVDKMSNFHDCCILQNQLLICGAYDEDGSYFSKDCSVVLPKYKKLFQMLKPRAAASIVEISQDSLWITGGYGRIADYSPIIVEKSTEIVSLNRPPIEGKSLPFAIHKHSMVAVDQQTIYLIGGTLDNGNDSRNPTNQCWIIDPTNDFDLKPGPSLQVARSAHSSSKIKINRKIYLVVAGGHNGEQSLDSVELLDTTSPHQGWISGPKLPVQLSEFEMVSSPKGVVVIGGTSWYQTHGIGNADLMELSGDSISTLKWTILKQKLNNYRAKCLAFSISHQELTKLSDKIGI